MDFYEGCRVVYTRLGRRQGLTGTVVRVDGSVIGVHFDECDASFHDLGGLCENGHGYWVYEDSIRPVDVHEWNLADDHSDLCELM